MYGKFIAAFLGCVASLAAFAQAQPPGGGRPGDTVTVTRGMNETVVMNLPATWKLGHSAKQDRRLLTEYVPSAETVTNWSEMVSLQIMLGLANSGKASLSGMLEGASQVMKSVCKDVIFQSFGEGVLDGRPAAIALIGCARAPAAAPTGLRQGDSEIGLHVVFKGREDLYFITKSRRGPGMDAASYPRQTLRPWQDFLSSIKLCDINQPPNDCASRPPR